MEATLVPIFICVILPIVIVWLVVRARKHEMDKKTEIMLKAIENGAQIDPQLFKTKQSTRSIKQELMDKFTGACVTSFMGIAFLVTGATPACSKACGSWRPLSPPAPSCWPSDSPCSSPTW